ATRKCSTLLTYFRTISPAIMVASKYRPTMLPSSSQLKCDILSPPWERAPLVSTQVGRDAETTELARMRSISLTLQAKEFTDLCRNQWRALLGIISPVSASPML